MIQIIPSNIIHRCSYYFALEEYVMTHFPLQEYFLLWDIGPSVIIGKHQLLAAEVNKEYIHNNAINLYRRPSGGGAVYADTGCKMFSFFSTNFNKEMVFPTYLGAMVDVLTAMGIPATFSGRNDLLVMGRKFSGNAFYRFQERAVLHGTMLFNTNIDAMVRALTPSNEKLVSKGIASVRERVINLCEITPLSQTQFFQQLIDNLCDSHYYLTEEDERTVRHLETKYLDQSWIEGQNPPFDAVCSGRSPKAGKIEIRFSIQRNHIVDCRVSGDFFALQSMDSWEKHFIGIPFTLEQMMEVVVRNPIDQWIQNASAEEIIEIMRGITQ